MRRDSGLVVLSVALVLIGILATTGRSKKPKPQPCPGGRYIVTGSSLVTGDSSGSIEPVVIGAQLSIGNACNPVHAKLKATKHGTTVKAVWPSCAGLKGKVKLQGTLDTTCATLNGTLIAKKSKVRETFVAHMTRCGDGIVDSGNGEECDGAACADGAGCAADCTCQALGSTTTTTTASSSTTTSTVPGQIRCDLGPKSCALLGTTVNCCGNGVVDAGEECDLGVNNDGLHGCSANCLTTRCGNCNVDPGETCDDGNTVDGDACPANCVIEACTVDTGTHQSVSLQLTTPGGVTVGGLTLLLDYPEGKVRLPMTTPGSGVIDTPNDLTYALKDALIDSTLANGIPANGAGPMLQVMFDGCQDMALPVAAYYKCTLLDASDESGNSIDPMTFGCAVTAP
jgi:cysteine-rich repeat protein